MRSRGFTIYNGIYSRERRKEGRLQLQQVVPVETAVLFASDGRFGVWRWGRPLSSVRLGSLCPRLSRLVFPGGGDGEAAASSALWNKFLRPRPSCSGAHSGPGVRSVRVEPLGSRVSAEQGSKYPAIASWVNIAVPNRW